MKWSNSFIPTKKETPSEAEAVSHRLMVRAGLIQLLTSGVYSYLPLGLRSLQKAEAIVREEMDREEARELLLPALQPADLWEATGRFKTLGQDMISFKDRHGKLNVLGPTHEEVITALIRGEVKSYRQLPFILYQIQTKFRDEARPRFGVIRSREFIMKDAYSFNADLESLSESYEKMLAAYHRIFERCSLETWVVEADPGVMGGNRSHEFLVPTESGEGLVGRCETCQKTWALPDDVAQEDNKKETDCPQCGQRVPTQRGLEIGHIFQLGTKYTASLDATFLDAEGKRKPILMGCYGIGVNRIVAAAIEQHHDADGIVWPKTLAPFQVVILPLLTECAQVAETLYQEGVKLGWEMLLDDRDERPGIKFKDADLIGIPYQLIIGKSALQEGKFEIKERKSGQVTVVSRSEILGTLKKLFGETKEVPSSGKASQKKDDNTLETLKELVAALLSERGAELVELTYRKEGSKAVLRVLADTPNGICLDECTTLNEVIGEALDRKNLIQESYLLEVASPGLDRPLLHVHDFERVLGKPIRLIFKHPIAGKADVEGVLESVQDEKLILRLNNEMKETYSLKDLSKGERIIKF